MIKNSDAKRATHVGRLLLELSKDFVASANELIRKRGHPYVQASHISVVSQIDEEGTELSQVVRRAGLSKQAVNKILRQLEDLSLVQTHPHPEDSRARRVCFTEKGGRFLAVAMRAVEEVESEYRRILGDSEFKHLKSSLASLLKARPRNESQSKKPD